ncbi:MAG: hypothetical protein C4290_09060 [Chloroflexota bacterium]
MVWNALGKAWDLLFGPPRVHKLPDGTLRVRLLGRVHEADDYEGLFRSVSAERDRLVRALAQAREAVPLRPSYSLLRVGPGEMYHRDMQRLEERLALYNEVVGHLLRHLHHQP